MESNSYKNYKNLEENPSEKANILSLLCFCYTLPLFWKGRKKPIVETDLYKVLDEHKSEILGNKLDKAWKKQLEEQLKTGKKPSLLKATINVFRFKLAKLGFIYFFLEFGLRLPQPYLIGRLIHFFSSGTGNDLTELYLISAAIILTSICIIITMHSAIFGTLHLGMKIRLAICSIIYRKALRLSKNALSDTTAGQIVNLLSNDVGRLDISILLIHFLWIAPLEVIVITFLMYQLINYGAFTGIVFILAFVPLQAYIGNKTLTLRLQTALRTDQRVRLMNEIIQGIHVIKMYAWEKPFAKVVEYFRKEEIDCIRKTSHLRGILVSLIMIVTRVSIFLSLATYALLNNVLDAQTAFAITAYYNVLKPSMTVFFPHAIILTAEAFVSIKRIQKFLLYNEYKTLVQNNFDVDQSTSNFSNNQHTTSKISNDDLRLNSKTDSVNIKEKETNEKDIMSGSKIEISHIKAKWNSSSNEYTLNDVSLEIKSGTLVAIIGPVGSCKSSLLQAILGELPIEEGKITIKGSISYASQEPWLFSGTIQQNILFGLPLVQKRYKTVVKICSLQRDFKLFPNEDKTTIGERGSSLSGGQKARISLARAVYRKCSIYLLDDPLSAVDTHVGRQLFDKCVRRFLHKNIVILVTHQLQFIQHADQIVILDHGKVRAVGSYDTLRESGLDFAELLEAPENEEEILKKKSNTKLNISNLRLNKSTSQFLLLQQSEPSIFSLLKETELEVQEEQKKGKLESMLYSKYLKGGGGACNIFFLSIVCILTQIFASFGDGFLAYWVKEVNKVQQIEYKPFTNVFNGKENNLNFTLNIDFNYINHTLLFSSILKTLGNTAEESNQLAVYIFTGINVGIIFITLFRTIYFVNVAMKASTNLHNQMFHGVTHATMYFFNTNPSGRILNRFSKDLGQIDEILPVIMIDVVQIFLQIFGSAILIAAINPLFLIPTVLISFIFYIIRQFYLKTSRNLKRIEAVARSPIYCHLAATLSGLSTIRCFSAEKILQKEFDNYQDINSSAFYMFLATSRAFGFWLDFFCVIYLGIITLTFCVFGGNGSSIGLAITQAIGLTGMVQWGMRQSAELENTMTCVERVVEYETVDPEPSLESESNKKPPPTWPEKGNIKFHHLSLRYFPDEKSEYVLKSLEFEVLPSEKIGIAGRTGAGKSSIISALFRLAYNEGVIEIDGRDIHHLGLHDLRSKISIIPQEPVLFSGTMRYNLDPFNEFSDDKLWAALEEVNLKDAISELLHGLQSKISEGGSNFSVGQRQLVCLARAILRENKILVMDEATANVDPQTDSLIQTTIRNKFKNCTVLTIAHRLYTIMDSDKILVMDAGHLVEFEHPYILLTESKSGIFYGMVKQTGKTSFDTLFRIAEKAYKSKNKIVN